MNAPAKLNELMPQTVEFKLDGRAVQAFEGESILQAAQRHGVEIPRLCYKEGLRPDGNCRSCVVEVKGERVLAPSCCRNVTAGMEVQATSERALKSQRMVVEMLLSDMPDAGYKWNDEGLGEAAGGRSVGQHGELSEWAERLEVDVRPAFKALRREQPRPDVSHPAMPSTSTPASSATAACVPAARSRSTTSSATPCAGPARRSSSTSTTRWATAPACCGECVQACPTGA